MKRIVLIILPLVTFLSCTSNTIYEKPKDLIPRDSMVILLRDLYVASSAKSIKNKNLQRRISYVPLVYQKYGIDSTRFKHSNLYYTSKIDLYEPMLKEIVESLEKERDIYSKIKKEQDSIRQDSLKKNRKKLLKEKSLKRLKED
ncbi:DUF4296 domain-containing protein [Pseudotenacibaculum haliotis]|uniref:DUF4296 domain-containing protein n=1 Tax=Pseudotenacibaculum haliotis TaxID=1862138 RepID=A0ABW5LRP2_9FLAO